jgi:hypothetical protein
MRFMFAAILTATLTLGTTPAEAVAMARADIVALGATHPEALFATRYLWLPDWWMTPAAQGAVQYTLNTAVSRSEILYRAVSVAGGKLLRVDLRLLSPGNADFWATFNLWEKLADFDPYFHVGEIVQQRAPIKFWHGSQWWEGRNSRQFGVHTGLEDALLLHTMTGSFAPIVRADWFCVLVLSTLDVGKSKGLYYDFTGFKGLNQKQWLALFGADEATVAKLNSASRIALFVSDISDRERLIEFYYGSGTRPATGPGLITVTHDIAVGDIDVGQNAIRNLVKFKDRAREAIALRPNGMQAYALFNAEGVLQDSVPEDIAHDSTKRSPGPLILEPGLSCISCHGPHDGYIPANNDVQTLYQTVFSGVQRGEVYGDKLGDLKALSILAAQYGGDLTLAFRTARDMHNYAAMQIAAEALPDGETSVVKVLSGELTTTRNAYLGHVDASKALLEIGVATVDGELPHATFNRVVPPLPINPIGFSPEDPAILALRTGKLRITRAQWEHVYADVMVRKINAQPQAAQ